MNMKRCHFCFSLNFNNLILFVFLGIFFYFVNYTAYATTASSSGSINFLEIYEALEILDINPSDFDNKNNEEIKALIKTTYRALAKKYHPDTLQSEYSPDPVPPERASEAKIKMSEVSRAYAVLEREWKNIDFSKIPKISSFHGFSAYTANQIFEAFKTLGVEEFSNRETVDQAFEDLNKTTSDPGKKRNIREAYEILKDPKTVKFLVQLMIAELEHLASQSDSLNRRWYFTKTLSRLFNYYPEIFNTFHTRFNEQSLVNRFTRRSSHQSPSNPSESRGMILNSNDDVTRLENVIRKFKESTSFFNSTTSLSNHLAGAFGFFTGIFLANYLMWETGSSQLIYPGDQLFTHLVSWEGLISLGAFIFLSSLTSDAIQWTYLRHALSGRNAKHYGTVRSIGGSSGLVVGALGAYFVHHLLASQNILECIEEYVLKNNEDGGTNICEQAWEELSSKEHVPALSASVTSLLTSVGLANGTLFSASRILRFIPPSMMSQITALAPFLGSLGSVVRAMNPVLLTMSHVVLFFIYAELTNPMFYSVFTKWNPLGFDYADDLTHSRELLTNVLQSRVLYVQNQSLIQELKSRVLSTASQSLEEDSTSGECDQLVADLNRLGLKNSPTVSEQHELDSVIQRIREKKCLDLNKTCGQRVSDFIHLVKSDNLSKIDQDRLSFVIRKMEEEGCLNFSSVLNSIRTAYSSYRQKAILVHLQNQATLHRQYVSDYMHSFEKLRRVYSAIYYEYQKNKIAQQPERPLFSNLKSCPEISDGHGDINTQSISHMSRINKAICDTPSQLSIVIPEGTLNTDWNYSGEDFLSFTILGLLCGHDLNELDKINPRIQDSFWESSPFFNPFRLVHLSHNIRKAVCGSTVETLSYFEIQVIRGMINVENLVYFDDESNSIDFNTTVFKYRERVFGWDARRLIPSDVVLRKGGESFTLPNFIDDNLDKEHMNAVLDEIEGVKFEDVIDDEINYYIYSRMLGFNESSVTARSSMLSFQDVKEDEACLRNEIKEQLKDRVKKHLNLTDSVSDNFETCHQSGVLFKDQPELIKGMVEGLSWFLTQFQFLDDLQSDVRVDEISSMTHPLFEFHEIEETCNELIKSFNSQFQHLETACSSIIHFLKISLPEESHLIGENLESGSVYYYLNSCFKIGEQNNAVILDCRKKISFLISFYITVKNNSDISELFFKEKFRVFWNQKFKSTYWNNMQKSGNWYYKLIRENLNSHISLKNINLGNIESKESVQEFENEVFGDHPRLNLISIQNHVDHQQNDFFRFSTFSNMACQMKNFVASVFILTDPCEGSTINALSQEYNDLVSSIMEEFDVYFALAHSILVKYIDKSERDDALFEIKSAFYNFINSCLLNPSSDLKCTEYLKRTTSNTIFMASKNRANDIDRSTPEEVLSSLSTQCYRRNKSTFDASDDYCFFSYDFPVVISGMQEEIFSYHQYKKMGERSIF